MCFGEGFADFAGVLQRLLDGQRTLERDALDVLHDQVVGSNVVERADVGMIQGRDGAGFALKTLTKLSLGNLDGHDAIKARVTSLVDVAHSARTDRSENLVRPEFVAGR